MKKQLNVRLPVDLIGRIERVKRAHRMRPTWDRLLELLVTGKVRLDELEGEVSGAGSARKRSS